MLSQECSEQREVKQRDLTLLLAVYFQLFSVQCLPTENILAAQVSVMLFSLHVFCSGVWADGSDKAPYAWIATVCTVNTGIQITTSPSSDSLLFSQWLPLGRHL